jgi:hypothetical protein
MKIAIALLAAGICLTTASPALAASAAPAWQLALTPLPTNFKPATNGTIAHGPMYRLVATNIGGKPTSGLVTLKATLPTGLSPLSPVGDSYASAIPACAVSGQTVTCTTIESVYPGRWIGARLPVAVTALSGETVTTEASAGGGGAATVSTAYETEINPEPPAFGFLPGAAGLSTLLTKPDGSAAVQAGSHPAQLTVNLAFPTKQEGAATSGNAGHPRKLTVNLPRGLLGNPTATPARCTEAQLISLTEVNGGVESNCPQASQVGTVTAMSEFASGPLLPITNLYNMVPPPGVPAELAFEAFNVGIFVHLMAHVRSDGDFGVSTTTDDIVAKPNNPVLSVQAQIWGDPSGESHDGLRGKCRSVVGQSCPVARQKTPFLTMPSACSGPLGMTAIAESWEEPGVEHEDSTLSTDLFGNPVGVNSCSVLEFEPTLMLKPDASMAETPTGVHVDLHVPQNEELENEAGEPQLATSNLKDTKVTFPAGMALNPAAASGLGACSPSQIGLKTSVGESPIHFSSDPPNCPDNSKIGTIEVHTPLLDHPVSGSVYVSQPYQNPFGTLLGAYVVVDDPADGIVIKLAGRTEADPSTGQLTTTFKEAPELPFEDFKVDLFGGSRAAFRTPSTCGVYATRSIETPWSGNAPVPTEDSFKVTQGANGRPCTSEEAQMPNSPGFEAGTLTPIAGSYSPLVGRLRREDGTQQLKGLNLTLPAGLTGKLAGIQICSDAAIVAAAQKTGAQELSSPSCPTGSQIGEVKVGAGAGTAPYYTTGKVYLAGPYQGAPISGVVITPAVAGPFDLGTVVVRAPGFINPATAQLSIKSGDFPHILQGIPLELRDAQLSLGRPEFILNPTNCEEKQLAGEAVSLLGGVAPLFQRFKVGGCRGLDYEPKLTIRLKGGTGRGAHPALRAVLTTKPGEANTARASVALPHSEFLENAHIQTVCTRVQFTAKACPAGSIYGHAIAITPLLEEPLEGPVYLRSSSHELPDMVAALKGPASRPIEVELDGRIDSIHGGIRSTFEVVPDQPVTKFILSMKGAKKGLLVNSRNLCLRTYRATAKFDGQNGKTHDFHPVMQNSCKGQAKKRHG